MHKSLIVRPPITKVALCMFLENDCMKQINTRNVRNAPSCRNNWAHFMTKMTNFSQISLSIMMIILSIMAIILLLLSALSAMTFAAIDHGRCDHSWVLVSDSWAIREWFMGAHVRQCRSPMIDIVVSCTGRSWLPPTMVQLSTMVLMSVSWAFQSLMGVSITHERQCRYQVLRDVRTAYYETL